jgi:Spy/CpxP family protein refolding chaperone
MEKSGVSNPLKTVLESASLYPLTTIGPNQSAVANEGFTLFITNSLTREVDMNKMKMCILAGIVLCIWATTAFGADTPGMGPANPMGPGGMHGAMGGDAIHSGIAKHLNLSKEQQDKLNALTNRYFSETRNMRYELAEKRLAMWMLFTDPKTSDATLLAKQKEISALRQKLFDKMAQMMIEGRKILTPDQLAKLDQMGMEMGMGMMHGGMMGGGMMGGGMKEGGMGHGM